jgi:hypothetical protein
MKTPLIIAIVSLLAVCLLTVIGGVVAYTHYRKRKRNAAYYGNKESTDGTSSTSQPSISATIRSYLPLGRQKQVDEERTTGLRPLRLAEHIRNSIYMDQQTAQAFAIGNRDANHRIVEQGGVPVLEVLRRPGVVKPKKTFAGLR